MPVCLKVLSKRAFTSFWFVCAILLTVGPLERSSLGSGDADDSGGSRGGDGGRGQDVLSSDLTGTGMEALIDLDRRILDLAAPKPKPIAKGTPEWDSYLQLTNLHGKYIYLSDLALKNVSLWGMSRFVPNQATPDLILKKQVGLYTQMRRRSVTAGITARRRGFLHDYRNAMVELQVAQSELPKLRQELVALEAKDLTQYLDSQEEESATSGQFEMPLQPHQAAFPTSNHRHGMVVAALMGVGTISAARMIDSNWILTLLTLPGLYTTWFAYKWASLRGDRSLPEGSSEKAPLQLPARTTALNEEELRRKGALQSRIANYENHLAAFPDFIASFWRGYDELAGTHISQLTLGEQIRHIDRFIYQLRVASASMDDCVDQLTPSGSGSDSGTSN